LIQQAKREEDPTFRVSFILDWMRTVDSNMFKGEIQVTDKILTDGGASEQGSIQSLHTQDIRNGIPDMRQVSPKYRVLRGQGE
jgi:hypothetical protein